MLLDVCSTIVRFVPTVKLVFCTTAVNVLSHYMANRITKKLITWLINLHDTSLFIHLSNWLIFDSKHWTWKFPHQIKFYTTYICVSTASSHWDKFTLLHTLIRIYRKHKYSLIQLHALIRNINFPIGNVLNPWWWWNVFKRHKQFNISIIIFCFKAQ